MALTYVSQSRFDDALRVNLEVLAKLRLIEGENSLSILSIRHNIARTHAHMRDHNLAEKIYREVLEKRQIILGREHPETLETLTGLASALFYQGKTDELGDLYGFEKEK